MMLLEALAVTAVRLAAISSWLAPVLRDTSATTGVEMSTSLKVLKYWVTALVE